MYCNLKIKDKIKDTRYTEEKSIHKLDIRYN